MLLIFIFYVWNNFISRSDKGMSKHTPIIFEQFGGSQVGENESRKNNRRAKNSTLNGDDRCSKWIPFMSKYWEINPLFAKTSSTPDGQNPTLFRRFY